MNHSVWRMTGMLVISLFFSLMPVNYHLVCSGLTFIQIFNVGQRFLVNKIKGTDYMAIYQHIEPFSNN